MNPTSFRRHFAGLTDNFLFPDRQSPAHSWTSSAHVDPFSGRCGLSFGLFQNQFYEFLHVEPLTSEAFMVGVGMLLPGHAHMAERAKGLAHYRRYGVCGTMFQFRN